MVTLRVRTSVTISRSEPYDEVAKTSEAEEMLDAGAMTLAAWRLNVIVAKKEA